MVVAGEPPVHHAPPAPPVHHAPPAPPVHHAPPVYHTPHHQPHYPEVPPKYAFNYAVVDHYSGANFGHSETRDGYKTEGTYNVDLPDGRKQTVNYADNGGGLEAVVNYDGEAKYPEYKPVYKPEYKPQYEPEYKPQYEPEYKPQYEPEYKPQYEPEYKPQYEPEYKPHYEPEYKPEHESIYPTHPTSYPPPPHFK
ncbi:uncharacterized protein [Cherax quadricarinatus]|uniref:uncharacterized protein n=1 Tax=Cherax quadricarinatus TaxID=27406 RepID=UPI00387E5B58